MNDYTITILSLVCMTSTKLVHSRVADLHKKQRHHVNVANADYNTILETENDS